MDLAPHRVYNCLKMLSIRNGILVTVLVWLMDAAKSNPNPYVTFHHPSNISHEIGGLNHGEVGSSFSPRMDFEQWKPLTGRGDPLRNDPTYDYEPPVLEKVHYWADDTRVERERIPEKKAEVLVLGVSSRKPSVAPRQPLPPPPPPPFKKTHRPPPPKFEDYTYKYSEYYPMTILVPPPPPPPGHQSPLYVTEQKLPVSLPKQVDRPIVINRPTTAAPVHLASFAVQEANLIYQSSTTSQNWFLDLNHTKPLPNSPVTSDYAGWGPTTPFNDNDIVNDTHNFISNDHNAEISNPYLFYKPLLSETPTSLGASNQQLITAFVPTALPPIETTISTTQTTWSPTDTTFEISTENTNTYEETTTVQPISHKVITTEPTPSKSKLSLFDMLAPMMSMPLVTEPDRPEDNLYAHASENIQVFKEHISQDTDKLEEMQNMKPPPPVKLPESTTLSERQPFHVNPHILNHLLHPKPSVHTHDPYLHMRFTTPIPTSTAETTSAQENRFPTEVPTVPMYLIIQGHSKVKTYSSKAKSSQNIVSQNEITKQTTNEVKHLHPLKEKQAKSLKLNQTREDRAQNLKSLIDNGLGSIEIQETDLGIKYDVSDGSNVPLELYKKGIVDSDENNYNSQKEGKKETRIKRDIDLEDLLALENDSIEDYVDVLIKGQKNETGITQLLTEIADSGVSTINELDDEDNISSELESEDR